MSTRKRRQKQTYTRKGGTKYGDEVRLPVAIQLSMDDPIIVFSEGIKQQLIEKIKLAKYDKLGWFRKEVVAEPHRWWFSSNSRCIINPELLDILPLVSQKLREHGFHVKQMLTPSDFLVEIEYANAGVRPVTSSYVIHEDNDNDSINGRVHTLMVCLDMDCEGGELSFYTPKKEYIESFDGKSKHGKVTTLLYDGGSYKQPEPITNGKRVVITYQIRQLGH
jgi:hypothetical protein